MSKTPHNPIYLQRIQKIWTVMRSREMFTSSDILKETGIPIETIRGYARALAATGYIKRVGLEGKKNGMEMEQEYHAIVWTVINDVGIEAPRLTLDGRPIPPSWREQIWRTIRIIKTFTVRDLTIHSRTEEVAPTEKAVRQYVAELVRAGVLVGNRDCPKTYRLVPSKNTGPRPHLRTRKGGVIRLIDQNTGKVIWENDNG